MSSKFPQAVAAIFICQGKIFTIVRQNFLKAFPGYTAYPGGKFEKGESWREALKREVQEELGFDLTKARKVSMMGTAITPDFNPYRFETYFVRVDLESFPPFHVDENEAQQWSWKTPQELISDFEAGEMLIVPPIRKSFKLLGEDLARESLPDLNFDYDSEREVPVLEVMKDIIQLMPLSNTLPPAERTNAFIIGGHLIDPSPKDEDEYQKLKRTLSHYQFDKIFLSHHHADHCQYLDRLADELGCSITMSHLTLKLLNRRLQRDWGQERQVDLIQDGDVLTYWLGQKVKVYQVPGHDEGQLGLMPEKRHWFFVGDLIQGFGTVVIAEPEGDMISYFESLEKVIALRPTCIFPSHGIFTGGTNLLENVLKHRLEREKQVLTHFQSGLCEKEILTAIYPDLENSLRPLALSNIRSHLKKLKVQKVI